jgi:NADH dehydrogenase
MDIASVCIFGGTGFVGHAVADLACARGYRVRVVTRREARARDLTVLPTLEAMVADPFDDNSLARCMDDMDAVINLVGILHPRRRASFDAVHAELPRRIAKAGRNAGVRHFVQMSALGAAPSAPSAYLRSKAAGEAAARQAGAELPVTVFRPSVIFGERDRFLNLFAKLARIFPVIPLASAGARFQPIWVEDVARCLVSSLGNPQTFDQTYELCGPRAYTLEELVRFVAATLGHKRRVVALPGPLASLQAFVFEHLPGHILTRDNLRSMSVDNVCEAAFPAIFGFTPSSLEAVAPEYLVGTSTRARYQRFRNYAGR